MTSVAEHGKQLLESAVQLHEVRSKIPQNLLDPIDVSFAQREKRQRLLAHYEQLVAHSKLLREAIRTVKDRQNSFLIFICSSSTPEADKQTYAALDQEAQFGDTLAKAEDTNTVICLRIAKACEMLTEYFEEVLNLSPNTSGRVQLPSPGASVEKAYDRQHKTRATLHQQLKQLAPAWLSGSELRSTWFRISGILHRLRKFEDFRNVLPILDLVKGKFPSEIQSKLHDLEFQLGEEFDIDAVMRHLDNIIASQERYSTTLSDNFAVNTNSPQRKRTSSRRSDSYYHRSMRYTPPRNFTRDSDQEHHLLQHCCDALKTPSKYSCPHAALMLAKAKARSCDSDELEDVILLLDSGAQNSFLATHAVTRLGLPVANKRSRTYIAFGGQKVSEVSGITQLTLVDLFDEELTLHLTTKDILTLEQKPPQLSEDDKAHIRKHGYDMPMCHTQKAVLPDLLIRIDNYWHILMPEAPVVLPSGMVLNHTRFGTVVSGLPVFRRLWSLDSLGITEDHNPNADTEAQDRILANFINNSKFIDGYLYVQFPWKEAHPKLQDNKQLAYCRLVNQYKKLRESPQAWKTYVKVIEDHLEAGYIEEVDERRFLARRGRPDLVYSDNSTTFHAAEKTIAEVIYEPSAWRTVSNYVSSRKIIWKFITPLSPWKGGFYERMVALFKSAFKKTVGRSLLQLEVLQTVIVEIESVINSRPLTPYRESNSLAHVLKPIDFVSPAVDIQLPPSQHPELQDASNKLTAWYHQSIRVLDSFWDIWHQDYLSALRERHQQGVRRQRSTNITPHEGQLVLMADDKLPRGQWPLAVIMEIHAGRDGAARSASVRTSAGGVIAFGLTNLLVHHGIPTSPQYHHEHAGPDNIIDVASRQHDYDAAYHHVSAADCIAGVT
ncbi:unnamed protein product [Heligmosomoides polygyrus]|uniref:Integrase catalytic domain-containing protein n=1 Tax=Heligmosomoides polygyrus TaxID=6339 RepID=A0A3P8BM51_HELPZ|nr:unnamed protein product [Heligmosomoides polygyrus]